MAILSDVLWDMVNVINIFLNAMDKEMAADRTRRPEWMAKRNTFCYYHPEILLPCHLWHWYISSAYTLILQMTHLTRLIDTNIYFSRPFSNGLCYRFVDCFILITPFVVSYTYTTILSGYIMYTCWLFTFLVIYLIDSHS